MKTIAVTGGKGGTGKSTVAIFLALRAAENGKRVVLVDADVECPNDFILLGVEALEDPVEVVKVPYPVLDGEKCTKCGLCASNCRANAIILKKDGTPVFNRDLCTSCGVCWNICPAHAISTEDEEVGEIFRSDISENVTLVTGRSRVGVRETSAIVGPLRKYAEDIPCDVLVIDTAAGSHCTVMRALEEADHGYAVTEPTPLGRHDLRVILGVLRELDIPSSVVINQHDIGDVSMIADVAGEFDADIAGKIPYSTELARYYARGALADLPGIDTIFEFTGDM
jgi:MinD superfamily P-loop ATPase